MPRATAIPLEGARTNFQIGCMTLPFSAFPFLEAVKAIRRAGNRYVAWGTRHAGSDGKPVELLEVDDAPSKAAMLARQCRDAGLEPVMLFARIYVGDAPFGASRLAVLDGAGRTLALKVLRPTAGVVAVVHLIVTPSPS